MKVARFYGVNDIRIETIPVPRPGPADALVRVRACGICSGDVMPWYIEKKSPLVLGHEPAGEVVETGSSVKDFRPGQRIFFHHHAPCFTCRYCRKKQYVQCETWRTSGIVPGGMSEYVLVPGINLQGDTLLLAEHVSFEEATLIEPLACVIKALKRAGAGRGDTVLVVGLGVMGQLFVMLAKHHGAEQVIGADMVPFRLERARAFGADSVIDVSRNNLRDAVREETDGEMAGIVVVGPGDVSAMSEGIVCAGRAGSVVFFTPTRPGDVLGLRPDEIYFRDINIISSYSCGPDDTAEALNLISNGNIKAEPLITHRYPLHRMADAYRITAEAKDSLKVIVTM